MSFVQIECGCLDIHDINLCVIVCDELKKGLHGEAFRDVSDKCKYTLVLTWYSICRIISLIYVCSYKYPMLFKLQMPDNV
jgi:hypothetical protein